ncbi:MAG: PadR family transcriptional regulator, partial [Gemmatimonadota bacterium]
MGKDLDLLHGTLDFLILKALSWGSMHGYGVARWIERTTEDVLAVEEGSLYPALHRLQKKGLLESEWGVSENNRRARYYRLTAAGQRELKRLHTDWTRFADAMARVATAEGGA